MGGDLERVILAEGLKIEYYSLQKQFGCLNHRVENLVAWFSLVIEGSCIKTSREVVSLLFPPLFHNEERGNKEPDCLIQLATSTR